jgi:predicted DCC family thiol-disulfide oxidoreductase YuxK
MLDLSERGYLLYDGDCGVCEALAEKARRIDRAQRFSIQPFQGIAEADLEAHHITYRDCERAIQVVTRQGRVYAGAFGVNRFLIHYLPWSLGVVLMYAVPIFLLFEIIGYRQFAQHRHHVSRWLGLTACAVPKVRPG